MIKVEFTWSRCGQFNHSSTRFFNFDFTVHYKDQHPIGSLDVGYQVRRGGQGIATQKSLRHHLFLRLPDFLLRSELPNLAISLILTHTYILLELVESARYVQPDRRRPDRRRRGPLRGHQGHRQPPFGPPNESAEAEDVLPETGLDRRTRSGHRRTRIKRFQAKDGTIK